MKLEEFIELFDNEVSRDLALKLFCEQFNCFITPFTLYSEHFEKYGICFSMYFRNYSDVIILIIIKNRKDLINICKFFNCENKLYLKYMSEDLSFSVNEVSKTIREMYITGIGRNLNYIVDKPIDCHDIKFGDLFFTEFNCVVKLFSHGSEKLLYSYRNYYSMKKEDE
jgi:hypothetical protein